MAQYAKPSGNSGTFNNNNFVSPNTGGLTIEEATKYFVTFPNTQSPSTIIANNFNTTGNLNVAGDSQFGGNATFIGGATITGPLVFENDVEVGGDTTLDGTLLCLQTATIDGELTASGGLLMTPLAPATNSIIDFVNAGGEVQLYLDPSTAYDMVFQSAQSEGVAGLSIINATSSFTMLCSTIVTGIVGMLMKNPINMNGNALYGISNIFAQGNTTTPLLTYTSGNVNMNNNTITNCNTINIGSNSTNHYGLLTYNTATNNLSISNPLSGGLVSFIQSGTNVLNMSNTTITSLVNLDMSSKNIINCAQLNPPSGSYTTTTTPPNGDDSTKIATTAWVLANSDPVPILTNYAQLTTVTPQTFTGSNTFTGFAGVNTTQTYPANNNQFVTAKYVASYSAVPYPPNYFLNFQDTLTIPTPVYTDYYYINTTSTGEYYNAYLEGNNIGNTIVSTNSMYWSNVYFYMSGPSSGSVVYFQLTDNLGYPPFSNVNITGSVTKASTGQQTTFTTQIGTTTPNYLIITVPVANFFVALTSIFPVIPSQSYSFSFAVGSYNQTPF